MSIGSMIRSDWGSRILGVPSVIGGADLHFARFEYLHKHLGSGPAHAAAEKTQELAEGRGFSEKGGGLAITGV